MSTICSRVGKQDHLIGDHSTILLHVCLEADSMGMTEPTPAKLIDARVCQSHGSVGGKRQKCTEVFKNDFLNEFIWAFLSLERVTGEPPFLLAFVDDSRKGQPWPFRCSATQVNLCF
jgi:hypothetical protein